VLLTFGTSNVEEWLFVSAEDGSAFVDLRRNSVRMSEKSRFTEPVDQLPDATRNARSTTVAAVCNAINYLPGLQGRCCRDAFLASIQMSMRDFYDALETGNPPSCATTTGVRDRRRIPSDHAAHSR
jgi:hypothetical protein